jgi:hypothetical protein
MLAICDVLFQLSHVVATVRDCGLETVGLAIAGGHLATCPPAWQLKLTDSQTAAISPAA